MSGADVSGGIIDMHAHFFPPAFIDALQRLGGDSVSLELHGDTYELTFENRPFAHFTPLFYDVDTRLRAMDDAGVATQAVSVGPPMVFWADADVALELSRIYNDEIAELHRAHPDRFLPVAAVPAQDAPRAAAEARRAVEDLGHRMVLLGTNIAGTTLDDPVLEELHAEVDRLDVPYFVHPINPGRVETRTNFRLDLSVAFPTDTTLTAARVILSGLLDRYPRLRFLWSHLGGSLPYLFDRIAHTVAHFPGAQNDASEPLDAYLDRYRFDTVVYSDRCLGWGVDFAGADRLVFGTDAPYFGDSTSLLLDIVTSTQHLSATQRQGVLRDNALAFLEPTGNR